MVTVTLATNFSVSALLYDLTVCTANDSTYDTKLSKTTCALTFFMYGLFLTPIPFFKFSNQLNSFLKL